MALVEQVSEQLKDAMRARDKVRVQALRGIRAAFLEALKSGQYDGELPDEDAIGLLRRLAKQRRESIEAYQAGGRDDLVEQEQGELAIIEDFLPKLADEATTRAWVQAAIAKTGASGPGDMGKVMGALMKAHKGDLDGKLANQLVRELLA
jgi:uncharacterized protein YqeY